MFKENIIQQLTLPTSQFLHPFHVVSVPLRGIDWERVAIQTPGQQRLLEGKTGQIYFDCQQRGKYCQQATFPVAETLTRRESRVGQRNYEIFKVRRGWTSCL